MLFLRFNKWLGDMYALTADGKIDLIIYEQAHHRGGAATEIAVGLTTRVQEFAEKIRAECASVHTATLKKYITGNGRASKQDMMNWFAETVGREPVDDNEADAMALLYYAAKEIMEEDILQDKE